MNREQCIQSRIDQLNKDDSMVSANVFAFVVMKGLELSGVAPEDMFDIVELEKIDGKWIEKQKDNR